MQRPKQVNIRIYTSTYKIFKDLKKPFKKKLLMLDFMELVARIAREHKDEISLVKKSA